MYLGYMTYNLLKYILDMNLLVIEIHIYKQVETSGYLLSSLFRILCKFKNNAIHKINQKMDLASNYKRYIYY